MKKRSGPPFYVQIFAAMAFGAIIGLIAGPRAAFAGQLGKVIISLIKALAGPLLFFAVVDAFLRTQISARAAGRMLAISAINAIAAVAIGLGISNILRPGESMRAFVGALPSSTTANSPLLSGKKIDVAQTIASYVPTSIVQPFVENSVISIVLLALLFGAACRAIKEESLVDGAFALERPIAAALRVVEKMLGWIVRLVPLAVFGVVAQTIGAHGFSPLKGLAVYVCVALAGLSIQIGIIYQAWLLVIGGVPEIRRFWSGARDAVIYALGASSSLATLPVTLRCLDRMGVSMRSARLAACVGTNFNHDGIILYEAMAVLFVAQAYGIHLSFGQQLIAALSCVIAGIGIAGVPDAGLLSLALVLGTVGLPTELLPLMLTVDWLLSRGRAVTNVISDMCVAVVLDKEFFSARTLADPARPPLRE